MLTTLAVDGYRSLRSLVVPLERLTVVTGENGSGKSSLYRSLRLLAAASRSGAIAALAAEGGLSSTLWAGVGGVSRSARGGDAIEGGKSAGPVAVKLGFASHDFSYAIDFGLPIPSETAFGFDPEIKAESVFSGAILRQATLLSERRGGLVRLRDGNGWRNYERRLAPYSSMLAELADPVAAPELLTLRDSMRSWRFYDHVRTDADAPARQTRIGTRTPVLASDGSDLAAALQTIREIGHAPALDRAVDAALPGSRVLIDVRAGRFALQLTQPGLRRPLEASELSDGTLRYLLWVAALVSERPAQLIVLNEPETSLHPALLEPLAELIAAASQNSQIIVVTHSPALRSALEAEGALVHELVKRQGETRVAGREGALDAPPWAWPQR
ncbi:MAG: AAA family ATPase [Microbacteriaceae bacterium]